jgi:hypothetical protein
MNGRRVWRGRSAAAGVALLLLVAAGGVQAQIAVRGASQASAAALGPTPGFRASSNAQTRASGATDLSLARPDGVVAGDLLVAKVAVRGVATIAPPAGWTLAGQTTSPTPGAEVTQAVFWRFVAAGEPAAGEPPDYTWTWGPSLRAGGGILAFSGVDPAAPVDALGAQTATVAAMRAPAQDQFAQNSMLVAFFASGNGGNAHTTPNGGTPAGAFTERWDQNTGAGPNGICTSGAYRADATAGTTGDVTSNASGAADSVAHLLVLRPAGQLTIATPPGTQPGDVMIASIAYRPCSNTSAAACTTAIRAPAGWTQVDAFDTTTGAGTGGFGSRLNLYRRTAAAGEPATHSWAIGGTPVHAGAAGGIVSFSGVDVGDPIAAQAGQVTPNNSRTHTAPSVTPSVGATMLLSAHAVNSSASWTPPAGMTERIDIASLPVPDSLGLALSVHTQPWPGTVPTGTRAATHSGAGGCGNVPNCDTGAAVLLALRPASSVDHYAIGYPEGSSGLTCQPLAVRITAHDAADNPVTPAAGTTITLSTTPSGAGWALKAGGGTLLAGPPRYVFSGTESFVELWLAQTTPATLDIDLVDGAGRSDGDGNALEDAPAVFADSGLVFDVPDHAAGLVQNVAVRALRRDDATQACVPAFANVTRSVRFWSAYANPGSGTLPVAINGSAIAAAAPGTAFGLAFDAAGAAAITLSYPDVGALNLFASVTFTGVDGVSRTLTGDDAFVVRPFGFKLAGLACAAPFSPAPGAFCPAGETVSATLTAVRHDAAQPFALGAATPNFGQESPAQGASFALDSLVMPGAGGSATPLAAVTVGAFTGGAAAVSFNWPQVGSFRVRPALGGASYLGSGDLPAAGADASRDFAGTIGRFHPYRFVVTDNGSAPGHPACTLTYAGQPFSLGFLLRAVAKDLAAVTDNYGVAGAGGYAPRLTAAALALVAENADDGIDRGAMIVTDPGGTPPAFVPTWTGGSASFPAASHRFRRGSAIAPYGPWDALKIGLRVVDDSGDAVPLIGDLNAATSGPCAPCDARRLVDTALRYGRLRIANTHGSELTQLPVPLLAEYWNGSAWVQNTLDACTALTSPLPAGAFSDYRRGLSPGETGGTLASPLVAGNARLRLSAPGAGNAGSVKVTIDSPAWLRYRWDGVDQGGDGELFDDDPSAVASFGVSRNNFIFMRENY